MKSHDNANEGRDHITGMPAYAPPRLVLYGAMAELTAGGSGASQEPMAGPMAGDLDRFA